MLASTIPMGIAVKIRKAVVRRSRGRSGYSTENRTGCSSSTWASLTRAYECIPPPAQISLRSALGESVDQADPPQNRAADLNEPSVVQSYDIRRGAPPRPGYWRAIA